MYRGTLPGPASTVAYSQVPHTSLDELDDGLELLGLLELGLLDDGFDDDGFDDEGFELLGFDELGLLEDGLELLGLELLGFEELGLLDDGFDELGLLEEGFDELGFDELGFEDDGLLDEGFELLGLDGLLELGSGSHGIPSTSILDGHPSPIASHRPHDKTSSAFENVPPVQSKVDDVYVMLTSQPLPIPPNGPGGQCSMNKNVSVAKLLTAS
jgi:hypothetical protein